MGYFNLRKKYMKPEDGYISFIINPKAGASGSKDNGKKIAQYLIDKGFDVRINPTSSLQDASETASHAAVDYECGLVVAVGGDGTVREVAHGLEGSDKPLLIVPEGTENLLANELGFDEKLETVIKTFEGNIKKTLDLGCINGKCFTCIAGFGFDGEVVKKVSEKRRGHITHMDYFWPIWRTFWNYKFPVLKVIVDDKEVFEGCGMVFVGNISTYAIGLHILRKAEYSDGLLDVCIYKCKGKSHLIKHSLMTLFKRHEYGSDVVYCQGKKISISSTSSNVMTEIDGDPGPSMPTEIKAIAGAVNVLVPKGAKPAGIRTRLIRAIR